MSKTDLTVAIENELVKKYYFNKGNGGLGRRYAFECSVYAPKPSDGMYSWKMGRVDFITIHKKSGDEIISCFEIKISKSDFKSKSGHNLVGDYNYYVVPDYLVEYVKEHRPPNIGIISYSEDIGLHTEVNPRKVKDRFMKKHNSIERIKHNMLTACNSTIRRLLSK